MAWELLAPMVASALSPHSKTWSLVNEQPGTSGLHHVQQPMGEPALSGAASSHILATAVIAIRSHGNGPREWSPGMVVGLCPMVGGIQGVLAFTY